MLKECFFHPYGDGRSLDGVTIWFLSGGEEGGGGAGVNPTAAYTPVSSGISKQEGAPIDNVKSVERMSSMGPRHFLKITKVFPAAWGWFVHRMLLSVIR